MPYRYSGPLWAVAACVLFASCATTATSVSGLEGRWRNVDGKIYFSDGTIAAKPPSQKCWAEFSKSQSVSECVTERRTDEIVYAHRLVTAGKYESEVLEHSNFPRLVGTRSVTEFRIANGTLFLTSYPPAITQGSAKYPIKMESTWVRE